MQKNEEVEQQVFHPPQESLSYIAEENELESSGSTSRTNVPHITVTNVSKVTNWF